MYREVYHQITELLRSLTGHEDVELIEGGEHADLASTLAFTLAREQHRSPTVIAQELAEKLQKSGDSGGLQVEAKGPYINFNFGSAYLEGSLKAALKKGYGAMPSRYERVALEHTSANPNGPLHVGHIRNSILGDTLSRVFKKAGYRVESQYYVNDIGRQIAIVVWGLSTLGFRPDGEKEDHYIARVYIAANRSIENDPGIVAEIDRLMQRVERGDKEVVVKFRQAVSVCLDGIRETLTALHISHNRYVWESDFIRNGDVERVIDRIRKLPQAREEETLWIDLTAENFEKRYILRRSDGTTVYAARDLAFHIWKGRNFDIMIDILGSDHKLIGGQLSATLRMLGEKSPVILHFEFVSLPEGSMSTRAGKFVSADDLITEITEKAMEEVTKRRGELAENVRRSIAHSVAIAAIRYNIVKVSPEKSTVFDWREALDFERQSGPYIQYAHARACSILEKADEFTPTYQLTDPHEVALAKHIALFPAIIEKVVGELRPHLLAAYARDLADLFNSFYRYVPVLRSEGITRDSRLTLVQATQNTLKEALETLGIDALTTM
ncbi:MAG: arginine--tRNA ligase [Methanomicrobiales archaeon]|nr:arginine--tRNA ligase [Methanomicrobiales archaeon]